MCPLIIHALAIYRIARRTPFGRPWSYVKFEYKLN